MGCSIAKGYANEEDGLSSYRPKQVNIVTIDPNPSVFKIIKHYMVNFNTVVMINYPNCTNYEGNKILVYKNIPIGYLEDLKEIDPHFSDKKLSPFARFEPTNDGWLAACKLVENL